MRTFFHSALGLLLGLLVFVSEGFAARTESDVPYAVNTTNTSNSQCLDLFVPDTPNFPTVVFVPGGIWIFADRKLSQFQEVARRFQENGVGCVVLSHRVSPQYKHPAHINDVASAFAWTVKNIESRGGDPGRVFLLGHSSGAQLAGLLASEPRYLRRHDLTTTAVRACITLGAPFDLYEPEYDRLKGGDLYTTQIVQAFWDDRSTYRSISPHYLIRREQPPFFLIVGEREHEAIDLQNQRYLEAARKAGATVDFFRAPDRNHVSTFFKMVEPDDPVFREVLRYVKTH